MPTCLLDDRSLLRVNGPDAGAFLQGLLTNDVLRLTGGELRYAALLTPQGKFLHDMFIQRDADGFLLDTDAKGAPALAKRLMLYRLRAKVDITLLPDAKMAACWDQAYPGEGWLADPRLDALGWRRTAMNGESLMTDAAAEGYASWRITHGVPDGQYDLQPDKSLIMEYGFDKLHAIDFAKGCYVGQEVTARSKHRATLRKGLFCITGETPLPPLHALLECEGQQAGEMLSSSGRSGLALLRLEYEGKPTTYEGQNLKALRPAWI